ncbi:MAG: hypothetical protein PHX08_09300 [Lachnospiraceae bacterium]|nr:hypothetical protein [Lachnospiraceae bacterium]
MEHDLIEQVLCDGENYDGARPCNYDWVLNLRNECVDHNVAFNFCGTGRRFIKDGRLYKIEGNSVQRHQAYLSGLNYQGNPIHFELYDDWGHPICEEVLYAPTLRNRCQTCGMKMACNGCSNCGACEKM